MRLWSIHPCYLDAKGIVALWREGLLAQSVLKGDTKGYKNHPQLNRFKAAENPLEAIASYLWSIVDEADHRNYNFNKKKIYRTKNNIRIPVTTGQLEYEFKHLLNKLKARDLILYEKLKLEEQIIPHPVFRKISGGIEKWEVTR